MTSLVFFLICLGNVGCSSCVRVVYFDFVESGNRWWDRLQGRNIRGRIYINHQGINAQVESSVFVNGWSSFQMRIYHSKLSIVSGLEYFVLELDPRLQQRNGSFGGIWMMTMTCNVSVLRMEVDTSGYGLYAVEWT